MATVGQTNKVASMLPMMGRDCYVIDIHPGVDAALVVALGIIVDDCKEGD